MGDKALEQQKESNPIPNLDIDWTQHPSVSNKRETSDQPSHLHFDDPYNNKAEGAISEIDLQKSLQPEAPPAETAEMSTYYANEYHRAAVGLGPDAFQEQVDELLDKYDGNPPPSLLGLPADASQRQINEAIQAKMRDNIGLPSNATNQEYLQQLGEYERLFATDDIAAFRRAEAGLPPSATDAQLQAVRDAYRDATLRASLGLSQLVPDSIVKEKLSALSSMDRHERADAMGLPRDPLEARQALDDRIKDNLGLPRDATRSDMLQRLMKYNEAASMNSTAAVDTNMRAQLGLDPAASIAEVLHAQELAEAARNKVAVGLPLSATREEVLAASATTNIEEREAILGLPGNSTNKEYSDAMDAAIKRELGLPKEASRPELMIRLRAYEQLAATNPEGALMRAKLGLSMNANFEEVRAALTKRLRPDE